MEAREAVAAYHAARAGGRTIDPSRVFLTASTSEAYAHLFRLLCDPQDEILVPRPSYPLLEPLARLVHAELRDYRLVYDGRWRLDLDSLEASIGPRTRAVVVIEPNNPTGSLLSGPERSRVEAICAERGLAILSDEVFGDFPWPPRVDVLPSWCGARAVPTFVLGGISKLCGLPQMKLGWIAVGGPEPELWDALQGLEWIADLFLSVGSPVQAALPRLLEARRVFQPRVRERLRSNLETVRAFTARRPEFQLLPAAGGWVAMLRVPLVRSEEEWALELLRRDVVVHPGHFYEYEVEGRAHIVLSLIVEPAQLEAGLARIETLAAT